MAEGDVAGISERLRSRLRTVPSGFPAVEDLLTAGKLFLTAAENESFSVTAPESSAEASVMSLKVEPGS